jgi:hypothetical protein
MMAAAEVGSDWSSLDGVSATVNTILVDRSVSTHKSNSLNCLAPGRPYLL